MAKDFCMPDDIAEDIVGPEDIGKDLIIAEDIPEDFTGSDAPSEEFFEPEDIPEDLKTDSKPKWRSLFQSITVEPVIFLFVLAGEFFGPVQMNFVYQRICLDLYSNDTSICDNLKNETYKDEEDQVQTDASHWNMYIDYCATFPGLILTFVYGVINDTYSQKIAMIVPMVGSAFYVFIFFLMDLLPILPLWSVLPAALIFGLSGAWATLYMATLAYITNVSTTEERSMKLAIADGMYSAAAAIAYFCGGTLFDHTSFRFMFILISSIDIIAIIYICIFIKNINFNREKDIKQSGVRTVITKIKDSVKNLIRKRPMNKRTQIMAMFVIVLFLLFGSSPTWTMAFLYLKRQPLSWSMSLYGYFLGYRNVLEGIGLMVMLPLLKRFFNVEDTVIMGIALLMSGLSMIVFSLSTVTYMVFLSAIIGMFGANMWPLERSILSFMIEKEEVGKVFAVFGTVQSLSALAADTVYNNIYPKTLNIWAGLVFALGGTILILEIPIIGWIHYDIKKRTKYQKMVADENGVYIRNEDNMGENEETQEMTVVADAGDGEDMDDEEDYDTSEEKRLIL